MAVEAGAQCFDHPPLKDRLRSLEHYFAHDQQHRKRGQRDPASQSPSSVLADLRFLIVQPVIFDGTQNEPSYNDAVSSVLVSGEAKPLPFS